MASIGIEERLNDRIVIDELNSVISHLNMLSPNGSENHKRDGLRQDIIFNIDMITNENEEEITFKEFRVKDKFRYKKQ